MIHQNDYNPFLEDTPLPFHPPDIVVLDLSSNELGKFPNIPPSASLQKLTLSENPIASIPNLASLFPNLHVLKLSQCGLSEFPKNLPLALYHLELNHNHFHIEQPPDFVPEDMPSSVRIHSEATPISWVSPTAINEAIRDTTTTWVPGKGSSQAGIELPNETNSSMEQAESSSVISQIVVDIPDWDIETNQEETQVRGKPFTQDRYICQFETEQSWAKAFTSETKTTDPGFDPVNVSVNTADTSDPAPDADPYGWLSGNPLDQTEPSSEAPENQGGWGSQTTTPQNQDGLAKSFSSETKTTDPGFDPVPPISVNTADTSDPAPDADPYGWLSGNPLDPEPSSEIPENQGGWGSQTTTPQNQENQGGWGSQPQDQENQGGWGSQPQDQENQGGWGSQPQDQDDGWGSQPQDQDDGWGSQPQDQNDGWGIQIPPQDQNDGWGLNFNMGIRNLAKELPNLLVLKLDRTSLEYFPTNLPPTLIQLDLKHNYFQSLPLDIGTQLPNLRYLDCESCTNITKFPQNLPPTLEFLSFSHCSLRSVPQNLATLLPNLTVFHVVHNTISNFPENLPRTLQVLDFSENHIKSIPLDLAVSFPNLITFRVGKNFISKFPETFPATLKYLDFSITNLTSCSFPTDPPPLIELKLDQNRQLTEFPENLPTTLRLLDISHNSKLTIPVGISTILPNLSQFLYLGVKYSQWYSTYSKEIPSNNINS